jgi:diguanylate cyclase (GGDEF)-like protein
MKCTISIGISSYPVHGGTLNEIINYADDAMYRSKRAGRNRVTGWLQAKK